MKEYVLDSKQCAKVALYMYQEWLDVMKPPLFVYKQFPEWLQDILDKADAVAASSDAAIQEMEGK